jgi:hypothetical protein
LKARRTQKTAAVRRRAQPPENSNKTGEELKPSPENPHFCMQKRFKSGENCGETT